MNAMDRIDQGLVPMINIVLLLLIFFLVAGQIDGRPEIDLSVSAEGVPHSLTLRKVELRQDGTVWYEGVQHQGTPRDLLVAWPDEQPLVLWVARDLPAKALDPWLISARMTQRVNLTLVTQNQ